jgi:putative FmdB family regulatory protein
VPTYEYTCRDCGHTFEIVQSMTDDPLTMCPECGGSLRKVFAPPAISFKGSGFYATDHGKKSKKPDGDRAKGDGKGEGKGAKDGKDGSASGSKGTATEAKSGSAAKAAPATKEPAPK